MIFPLLLIFCIQTVFCDEYPSVYNVDLDEVLKNDRLLKNYVDCVLERGKCTPEGEELKRDIPDALQNGCAKCSDKHKEGIKKVIHHLIENKKDLWGELEAKFDPKGEYKKKYHDLLVKEGLAR